MLVTHSVVCVKSEKSENVTSPESKSIENQKDSKEKLVSNHESFGAGVGDSVPPHLASCEGVEHLVFEEEPQSLPLPLALLPALEAAAHCGVLKGQGNLINVETKTIDTETHKQLNVSPCHKPNMEHKIKGQIFGRRVLTCRQLQLISCQP